MLNVHVRINEAGSGKPTPVRVRVSTVDGTHFAPLGRSVEFPVGRNEVVGGHLNLARDLWFTIDGACEIPLPAGVPLRVQVTKGPEYRPVDETVTLGDGQLSLRLAIARWTDPHADGWVSVDTRCHFLTPHDALLEAAAEGVDVVNLLATVQRFPAQNGTAYLTVPNLTAFSGQVPLLERDGHKVFVNTLNTHPVLGTVGLLNSHRPVFPLTFGGEEPDDWGICDWCDQCGRKGGLRVWVDAFEPTGGLVGGEALIAAILGKIDAIEVNPGPRKVPLLPWVYRLWDAGVLVPLVGGSSKDSNKVPLAAMRTYAKISTAEPSWIAAVRAGHIFATSGSLINCTVSGSEIHATARSLGPFDDLALVANGRIISRVKAQHDPEAGCYRAELTERLPDAGWVAVRCHSAMGAFAHTPPVAVGSPIRDPGAVASLRKLIEQTREWAEQHGRYVNSKRRDQLLARCVEAADKLGGAP
ncbi:MAG: hypothetical protein C0467_03420 [Planctomycetaceae bacterium]|nr:hypothetical protein [Planctomycetaceae bacterium]